ncbi:Hypothetical protein A7982_02379 [Minicystis rosea]|nr:Hypothetical protein A7982_02379 [Minicystis rosea]
MHVEDRKATRKAEQAALEKLAARLHPRAARLRDLAAIACGPSAESFTPAPSDTLHAMSSLGTPADDPLRLALHASLKLPEEVAAARDAFLATELDGDDADLVEAWSASSPGGDERAAAVAALARRGLVRASLNEISFALPQGLAGLLVAAGRWSARMALCLSRVPHRGIAPETLASLAPWLDAAEAREALAIVAGPSTIDDIEDADGVAAVVSRLVALEGHEAAERALAPFSPAARALVAAVSWRSWPRALHPLAARLVAEGVAQVRHCSHAAGAAFSALPLFAEPERGAIVRRALERLGDEDFGLDCEHAALLGAAGLWSYGWENGSRDTLPYPRAQMLAHVVHHLPGELRDEGYARWLDAYRRARKDDFFGLEIPKDLPPATFDAVLAMARDDAAPAARAHALVRLAYQRAEVFDEALAAVEALSGAPGACARLSLLPVAPEATRSRLAIDSHDTMLALIDAGREADLRNAAERWPRGPDERLWCYLSCFRRSRAILVAPLAFMPAAERDRRACAMLERWSRSRDRAILAGAAAAVAAMPEPARPPWIERLSARVRPGDTHPIALVAVASLLSDPDRAALAIAAWSAPRIGPDEEHATGRALARASRWIEPSRRAPLQLAALERWSAPEHPYQWTALIEALQDALEPEAVAWIRAHTDDKYAMVALLPALPDDVRREAAARLVEEMTAPLFFWRHDRELKQLYPYVPDAGTRVLASIDRWRDRGLRLEEEWVSLAIARALDPIAAAGHVARAFALRAEIVGEEAAAIADLALARHEAEGPARDARIASAIAHLEGVGQGPWADEAWEAALRWLAPGPHRRRALAVAEALPGEAWLVFARAAEATCAREELAAQLTEARIASLTPELLLTRGLALDLWAHRLDASQIFSCWRRFWQDARELSRSRVMLGPVAEMIALAVRAAGPGAAEQIAESVLDVAAWFP